MNWKELFKTKSLNSILTEVADNESHGTGLSRQLGIFDLTAFGIAAIIGAGIFATIGGVCFNGGPGVIFLFIFTAIACGFAAMCYASFASMIPISGSAYTYAYASFGELFAWIIGWDLIIEYAIGNVAVAIGWSGYFTELIKGFGINIPNYLCTDYWTASTAFANNQIDTEAYNAYINAPKIFGLPFLADLPAFLIVIFISMLTYIGIKETRNISNAMVILKVMVIILVIVAGAFYVNPANWSPLMPNGWSGVMKGVSGIFFAYIGFDAISTTAEECKNPQKDLPRSMLYSLLICTLLYILLTLVLTGMVPYTDLDPAKVSDPLAFVFSVFNVNWISYIVSISAIIAMASVLLVFQLGQPRIWMAMSRDRLLPPIFSDIHPKYKTPWFSTIITALLVAIPALFLNITIVTDLTSIGTLFAFVLVCGGTLILDVKQPNAQRKFKIPFIDSKYVLLPFLLIAIISAIFFFNINLSNLVPNSLSNFILKIPLYIFIITYLVLILASFKYKLSLIPVLGLLSCLYLMSEIHVESWYRFAIWLVIGLFIYVFYGYKKSKLREQA